MEIHDDIKNHHENPMMIFKPMKFHDDFLMDFMMIIDIPEAMAVKFSLHVGASGVFNGKLTPLITVEGMEEATSTELPSMRLPGE